MSLVVIALSPFPRNCVYSDLLKAVISMSHSHKNEYWCYMRHYTPLTQRCKIVILALKYVTVNNLP